MLNAHKHSSYPPALAPASPVQGSKFDVGCTGSAFFRNDAPSASLPPSCHKIHSAHSLFTFCIPHSAFFISPRGGGVSGGADPNRSLLRRTSGPVGPQWLCPQRGTPPSPTRSNETKFNQFGRGGGGRCLRLYGASGPLPLLRMEGQWWKNNRLP